MVIASHVAASTPPSLVTYTAIGVSVLALIVSGASLWRTHFSPMHLIVASGPLDLRITPFRTKKGRWFVVDAIGDFTFTNSGARPGIVRDARLKVEYPSLPIPKAHEYFDLNSEVDPRKFEKYAKNRLDWKDNAEIGEGAPFVLLPKESKAKKLVFWGRWEAPVIQPLTLTLEVYTDHSRKWVRYDSWQHQLDEELWSHLANERGSMSASPTSRPSIVHETNPPDLHKYTGTKNELKKKTLMSEPSYLDYPDNDAS